jgi:prepilin-type N-terminal cleavage/methylation domain-containing protein
VKTQNHKAPDNRRGFTLIELLVVIAIIALLLAILMPALSRVKKQARSVACQASLKQWILVWKLYTDDNDGYFHRGLGGESQSGGDRWPIVMREHYKTSATAVMAAMVLTNGSAIE